MKAITFDIDRTGSNGAHVAVRIGEQHRSRAYVVTVDDVNASRSSSLTCGIPVFIGVDLRHGHRSEHVGHDRRQTVRGHLAVERRDEDRARPILAGQFTGGNVTLLHHVDVVSDVPGHDLDLPEHIARGQCERRERPRTGFSRLVRVGSDVIGGGVLM